MGNQGDDRYGGDRWRDRDQGDSFGRDRDFPDRGRGQGRDRDWNHGGREASGWGPGIGGGGDRDRGRSGGGGEDRGFFERAGEEVRSWFGSDDGGRGGRGSTGRRDNGYGDREHGSDYGPGGSYGNMAQGWGNQSGESWNRDRPGERGWFTDSIGGERGNRPGASGGRSEGMSGGMGRGTSGMDEEQRSRGTHLHDPHYAEWRRRQMEELDRDYEEYRREHQSKFEQEFGNWRTQRQGQRRKLGAVTEQMEVLGSDGTPVGTVDKVRGDRIILTKSDADAGGIHHSIPCSWVETVDDKVMLNRTAEEARKEWRDEEHSRALFERQDSGSEGPHMLNRSFSGTYRDREG